MPEEKSAPDDAPAKKKLHRELDELLQELRVIIPGVTVLFAFLITVPFSSGFGEIEKGQKDAFFILFLTTFASLVLLVAPGANHRLRFRANERHFLIPMWNWLAVAGIVLMCASYILVVYLVTSVVVSNSTATVIAVGFGVPAIALWFVLPLLRNRMRSGEDATEKK